MRIALIVFFVCIAYSTCFPTLHENDDEELDLEVRSILNHLEQQEARAIESDEDSDQDEQDESSFQMSKRQGGHNIIDQQSKCEIECIGKQRKAETGGGKSVKEAAKVCRNVCGAQSKKRGGKPVKKQMKGKASKRSFLNLREDDDDDENDSEDQSESSEEQQRREFFELLQEQLENENDE